MSVLIRLCKIALKLTMRSAEIWKALMCVTAALVLKDKEMSVRYLLSLNDIY